MFSAVVWSKILKWDNRLGKLVKVRSVGVGPVGSWRSKPPKSIVQALEVYSLTVDLEKG